MNFKLWLLLTCSALHLPAVASLCDPCNFATSAVHNETPPNTNLTAVAFSQQGCLAVANNTNNNLVQLYSVDPVTCIPTPTISISASIDNPQALAFSPTGSCLAVANSGSGTVTLYSINSSCADGTLIGDPISLGVTGVSTNPQSIAFSSQGCLAIVRDGSNEVLLYSVDTGCEATLQDTITLVDATLETRTVAFSSDGNCLAIRAAGGLGEDDFVFLYTINNCTAEAMPTGTINLGDIVSSSIAFSLDNCLAVAVGNAVNLYSISNCTVSGASDPIDVGSLVEFLSFSARNCLAVVSQNLIDIYAIDNCTAEDSPLQTITIGGGQPTVMNAVAFSTDGSCLASVALVDEANGDLSVFQSTVPAPPIINVTASCNTITVMGTTRANASVAIFVDGIAAATVNADGSGAFAAMLTEVPGTYAITAQATDVNPPFCISGLSGAVSVTVPTGPTIIQATSTCLGTVNVIGSAAPGTSITILVDGIPAATGIAFPFEGFGRFIIVNVPVSTGFHCLTAVDNAGGCIGAPVCLNVTPISCILIRPNLAFGTHCCNRLLPIA